MWVIFTTEKNWGFVYILETLSPYLVYVIYIKS